MAKDTHKGYPFLTLLLAVVVVAGLSFVPWTRVTGGFFKDFDLLEDISDLDLDRGEADEMIDPLLAAEMSGNSVEADIPAADVEEVAPDTITGTPYEALRRGELVLMEDFHPQGHGLARFKHALSQSGSRPVRIGVIGDSYIEGDIFTQDIRELLQAEYGGRGVGYVPLTSEVEGFRRSVRQNDSGWTEHDLRQDKSADCRWLSGQRFTGDGGATATWKSSGQSQPHSRSWNRATVLFKATAPGQLALRMDAGERQSVAVDRADTVQCISVGGEMSSFSITNTSVPGLTVYGVWLTDSTGIVVDGMSLRGNSGIVHASLSPTLAADMRNHIDYDLIVLEYGLNAVTSKQKDYTYYGKRMLDVIGRLRECYPNADIIVMGAGDRGQKSGSDVHSMPTVQAMVNTQRAMAREAGVVFWDTRAAMGGEDAIVDWRNDKLVNADYIHLNFDGGRRLAELFVKALDLSINE